VTRSGHYKRKNTSKVCEKMNCDPEIVVKALRSLGYSVMKDSLYAEQSRHWSGVKRTRYGRIHVLISRRKKGCTVMVHHDLMASRCGERHFTSPYDPRPWWAWKDIERAVYEEIYPARR